MTILLDVPLDSTSMLSIATRSAPSVCVVVPTRNEAANVLPLLERLRDALIGYDAEVIFVDDSDDDTPSTVRAVQGGPSGPVVRLLHRAKGQRTGGLGGAVQAGLGATTADVVVVMDGDLQHPPEVVPALVRALHENDLDVVVGSRYCGDGDAAGLSSVIREFASSGATTASRILFPRALGSVTDPMSGFFALRRSAVDPQVLHPRGFKILLEILTRAPHLSVGEVPFIFSARGAGESKAGLKEGTRLLRQLLDLRLATWGRWVRPAQFAVVGASGIGVNLAVLAALLALGIGSTIAGGEMLAAIASTQVALAWNCLVTERWVFPDRRRRPWSRPLFWALSNLTLGVQLLLAPALLPYTRGSYLLATGVAILALAAVRFVLCDRLLYAGRPAAPPVTAPAHDGIALVPPWTISVRQLVEPTTTGLTGERDLAAVLQ